MAKLSYKIVGPNVLPEILRIIDDMILLYNDWEAPTYLKLEYSRPVTSEDQSPTTTRYELYPSKEILRRAILDNLPLGCTLVNE